MSTTQENSLPLSESTTPVVKETSLPTNDSTNDSTTKPTITKPTSTVDAPTTEHSTTTESTSKVDTPATESKQGKSKSNSNLKVKSSSVKKTVGSVGLRNKNKTKLRQLVGFKGPTLRRLARRGGVKRISKKVYDTVNGVAVNMLEDIVRSSMIVSSHAGRKMISLKDVLYTLSQKNCSLYGF